MLHGSNSELVIQNIQQRAADRRKGVTDTDGRKIALIIEGGGMRSVCSGAGAAALGQLGLHDVFDEVYASSAGTMNAAYFMANQPLLGMSVYFDNCTTWSFLNPFRIWKILDVDYIVDHVVVVEKPLDVESIKGSSSRLLVSVCDSSTGENLVIDVRDTMDPVHQVFKAAMALPVLYNRSVLLGKRWCIDSGAFAPFPLEQAFSRMCTDVLVLQTRPATFKEERPSLFQRMLFNSLHAPQSKHLRVAFAKRQVVSRTVRDLALGRTSPPERINVASICPKESEAIESMTTNRKATHRAAIGFGRQTFEVFGSDPDQFTLGVGG